MASTIPSFRQYRRRLRLLALPLLVLFVSACSGTSFLYNRLDFLVPWYVDDYVDLNSAQDDELELMLEPFLAWHRREELPRYVDLLQLAEAMLDDSLTLDEVRELAGELETAADRVQTRSLDWMLPLGQGLSEGQIAEFLDTLKEQQEELEEEYLDRDLEEYREEAYERFLDNCEDYLGRLDKSQRDTVRRGIARLSRSDFVWLQERQDWVERLRRLLQREPGWQEEVRRALAQRWEATSPEYKGMYERNLAVIQQTLVEVINSRSERQDRRLRNKLADLREDFTALSQQGLVEGAAVSTAAP